MYDCTHVYKCKFTPKALVPVYMYDVGLIHSPLSSAVLPAAEQFLGSVHLSIHNHAYAYVPLINSMYFLAVVVDNTSAPISVFA